MKTNKVAICYDFDSTLCPDNMQEYNFMKAVGFNNPNEFWALANQFAKKNGADNTIAVSYCMLNEARKKLGNLSKAFLNNCGKGIVYFPGVESWFNRITEYAKFYNIELEHYIISSGNKEIIDGTSISKHFKKIYATSYAFDENNNAIWPALAVNYTNKTQYLYRINKGILDEIDNSLNDSMPQEDRPIPFTNMIYIGDSLTDIPCMRLVMKSGGTAIGLYSNGKQNSTIKRLITENKINYAVKADYSEGSDLEKLIEDIIVNLSLRSKLNNLSEKHKTIDFTMEN